MSFGAHGHDMLATLRDQLGLPLPIHQYFDHEARVWRRWVRAGESIQVLPSRGGEVEVR